MSGLDTLEQAKMPAAEGSNAGLYAIPTGKTKTLRMSGELPGMGTDPQQWSGQTNDSMQATGEEIAAFMRTLSQIRAGDGWNVKKEFAPLVSPTYKVALQALGRLAKMQELAEKYETMDGVQDTTTAAAFFELESLKREFKTDSIVEIAMHLAVVKRKLQQDKFNKRLIHRYTAAAGSKEPSLLGDY